MPLRKHQETAIANMAKQIQSLETVCADVAEYVRHRRQTREGYGWWPEWAQKLEDMGYNCGQAHKTKSEEF